MGLRHNPVVYLATAPNAVVAQMWTDILLQQGIHSVVKTDDLWSAQYVFIHNLSCELHVLASKAKKAREILEPFLKTVKTPIRNKARRLVISRNSIIYVMIWAFCYNLLAFSVMGVCILYQVIRRQLTETTQFPEQ
jgi:hypothetical protein